MKQLITLLAILWISTSIITPVPETASCDVALERLTENLYLDTTLIPAGFDRHTLTRLYSLLASRVIPDIRTPYPEHVASLPVIIKFVTSTRKGHFPVAAEGFAGLCDMVLVDCDGAFDDGCQFSVAEQQGSYKPLAFLALVTVPGRKDPDYLAVLWGLTAHEIAHALGAIDGPHCPYYEGDKLLAPVEAVSDTYYWFGVAHLFEPGWQGLIWDAWHDTCDDPICELLRHEVFYIEAVEMIPDS